MAAAPPTRAGTDRRRGFTLGVRASPQPLRVEAWMNSLGATSAELGLDRVDAERPGQEIVGPISRWRLAERVEPGQDFISMPERELQTIESYYSVPLQETVAGRDYLAHQIADHYAHNGTPSWGRSAEMNQKMCARCCTCRNHPQRRSPWRCCSKSSTQERIRPRLICAASVPKPKRWEGYTSASAR
jgi:hypothetical protein